MMVKDLMMHYNNELYECYKEYAKIYNNCKKENREETIDDKLLERVSKGGYIHDNGFKGVEEGYKPYYNYLKYGNQYQEETHTSDSTQIVTKSVLQPIRERIAKRYKKCKERGWDDLIDDNMLKTVAKGGYYNDNETHIGMEEGYIPYYEYLKYDIKPKQEEQIMIEDNYNYETPYSFEYEPYMIEFNHEVTYNEPIYQQQEVVYEEPVVEEVDIDDVINIMDILTNRISKVKNTIIHYISNYRPIMNHYTGDIDTILIE